MKNAMDMAVSPIGDTVESDYQELRQASPDTALDLALDQCDHIARLVVMFRLRNNLTQQELAARAGTSHAAISRIERGQHRTSVETLRKLAHAMGAELVVSFAPQTQEPILARPTKRRPRTRTLRNVSRELVRAS